MEFTEIPIRVVSLDHFTNQLLQDGSKFGGTSMNASLFAADRATHVKIVTIALVAAIVLVAVRINARSIETATVTARNWSYGSVVKAGKPTNVSIRDDLVIR
jgi:hypothetical protein